jgi:hypothetical protein
MIILTILNQADLTTENNSVVVSQTAPDTITPTTLGGLLQDIIDSMINQIDQIVNGSTLTTIINNAVSTALTGQTLNGIPGQFAVTLGDELTYSDAALTTRRQIKFLNESANGAFDNGGNFFGGKYVVPTGGFTGKFELTDIEIQALYPPNTDQTYTIEINEYNSSGVFQSTLATTSFEILIGALAGDIIPANSIITASATWAAGRIICVDIKNSTPVSTAGIATIKSMMFNNLSI